MAELADSLREFTKNDVPFVWGPEHSGASDAITKEITIAPILKYYDPSKSLALQTDTSLKGLGAVLIQGSHPIYFASKCFQLHQKAYAAIELKCLAVS